jgi:hypothetical protein
MYFWLKSILKSNYNHTFKHPKFLVVFLSPSSSFISFLDGQEHYWIILHIIKTKIFL